MARTKIAFFIFMICALSGSTSAYGMQSQACSKESTRTVIRKLISEKIISDKEANFLAHHEDPYAQFLAKQSFTLCTEPKNIGHGKNAEISVKAITKRLTTIATEEKLYLSCLMDLTKRFIKHQTILNAKNTEELPRTSYAKEKKDTTTDREYASALFGIIIKTILTKKIISIEQHQEILGASKKTNDAFIQSNQSLILSLNANPSEELYREFVSNLITEFKLSN